MNTYEAALEYTRRGWRVIPIRPRSKVAAVQWKKYQDQEPTDAELKEWFQNTDNNIAVLTGDPSGIIAVDEDSYKETGQEFDAPTGLIAKTPRGGRHKIFLQNGHDVGNSQGVLPGIDVRGNGGYILVAPSIVEYSDGSSGCYEWEELGDPSDLPDVFFEQKEEPVEISLAPSQDDALNILYNVIMQKQFDDGQHNDQILQLSRLGYRALYGDSDQLKRDFLVTLLKALDLSDPTPQAATGNLVPTIQQGINYERQRMLERKDKPVDVSKVQVHTLADTFNEFGQYDLQYLVDELIPLRSMTYIAALPENYKTWLMLEIAVTVALGDKATPVLGQFAVPQERKPVLVLQQEDFMGLVMSRVRTLIRAKTQDATWDLTPVEWDDTGKAINYSLDHPLFAPIHFGWDADLQVDDEEAVTALEHRIEETGAELVCIDPFYTLEKSKGDDYFSKSSRQLGVFKEIRTRFAKKGHSVTFLFVHHAKKGTDAKSGRGGAYGSVFFDAAMEGAIILAPVDGGIKITRSGKFQPGAKSWIWTVNEIDTTPGKEKYDVSVEDSETQYTGKYDAEIVEVLRGRKLRKSDVASELSIGRSTASRALDRLVDEGHIEQDGNFYSAPLDVAE